MELNVNGKVIEVKKLGNGAWTTAYQVPNKKTVYLQSRTIDTQKEALLDVYHKHLPIIRKVDYNLYRTVYTDTLSNVKHPELWRKFTDMVRLWKEIRDEEYGLEAMTQFVDKSKTILTHDEWEALYILFENATRYSADDEGMFFDFQFVNFGVDHKGRLIFRDIIADPATLHDYYADRTDNYSGEYEDSTGYESDTTPAYIKAINPDQLSLGLTI
jgi:hypothetical protein